MSRVAKLPIIIPTGVEIKLNDQTISIQGKNGLLIRTINSAVIINHTKNVLTFTTRKNFINAWAQAGTARSLIQGMIVGVTDGFTKKLSLVGIGYRVVIKDNIIILSIGFSHQIKHLIPLGITATSPTPTEIILQGADKQMIGQVASDLRSYRHPEPYKGKGIRYEGETIRIKEAKKK